MIKSARRTIMDILNSADVEDEELITTFCGAEGSTDQFETFNLSIS